MPPPPKSGLGPDHPYAEKVVNTPEVQLVKPRVPHPITNAHAMSCLALVNELEHLQQNTDPKINANITEKLTKWFCPPGFSWDLTFNTPTKRKQALDLAKSAAEILNMRVRREAQARDMAQQRMDTSAKGMFIFFKYDIEREYQLLTKFRRSLFCIELGEKVSAELDRIKRLKQASVNTGIGDIERSLFEKILKAKIAAAVEEVAAKATPKPKNTNKQQQRVRCSYCKKRHPGGAAKCRKRKQDRLNERTDNTPTTRGTNPKAQPSAPAPAPAPAPPPPRKKKAVRVTPKANANKSDE